MIRPDAPVVPVEESPLQAGSLGEQPPQRVASHIGMMHRHLLRRKAVVTQAIDRFEAIAPW